MSDIIIGFYNRSVILTYVGIASALTGIAFLAFYSDLRIAMLCLILCGICDLFDGVVARRCKRTPDEEKFGVQIDSLADVISFLIFPVVILYYLSSGIVLPTVVGIFYVLCGVSRLGWFNITNGSDPGYFQGLPVTYSALIVPVYYVIMSAIVGFAPEAVTAIIYFLIGVFYVLNIRIAKPRGIWYVVFPVIAVATSILLILE